MAAPESEIPAPTIVDIAYEHEALLFYATPNAGYHDRHFITLEGPDPGQVNELVQSAGARSRLAFFYVTKKALITLDHGDTTDVINMSNVHYNAPDGLERLHGKPLMATPLLIASDTDRKFDLITEAEIVLSGSVPERVRGWLETWRHGHYDASIFPEIQKML